MEFSRPEYWSQQAFPSPGDLPNPGIKARPPALQADSLPTKISGKHPQPPKKKETHCLVKDNQPSPHNPLTENVAQGHF